MTATTLVSSTLNNGLNKVDNYKLAQNIYQVEVNGEDGDCITFEVMADSISQASETAEQLAMDEMVDISYMNITVVG